MSITCPKCEHSDRITKVSAIFSGGISSGTYQGPSVGVSTPIGKGKSHVTGGYTTLRGSSQTMLSERLAPPVKPQKPGGFFSCSFFIVVFLLYLGTGLLISTFMDMGDLAFIPFLIIATIAYIIIRSNKIKTAKEKYSKDLPRWELAVTRWDSLYYCERDDLVFDPDTNEAFHPGELMNYLFR